MIRFRRFVSAMLALIIAFTMTACGSSNKGSTPEEDEDPLAYLNGQFRVGMECAYAPNNWQEATATETNVPIFNVPGAYAEGFDVQWAKIIADHLGLELVVIKMDWDGLIEALNKGQIDAIIAGMMDTAERRQSINFSSAYHETQYGMMVNAGSPFENAVSIQDFSGASVLGQKDTALDTVIDQINGVNHLPGVSSVPDMVARLQQGTCDALVINMENAPGYIATNPNFVAISFEEGNGFELPAKGACVGIRKTDDYLLSLVNEALATVDQAERDAMWDTAVENQPV
ncbi:MAG: transporter substrate-binding domain-containing protein [Oscillospiraceae bacterium]|nr:transporter substrate-binding domain-containing protein [Oscillospiraceae bacterium]